MSTTPKDIDDYLSTVAEPARSTLEQLRRDIRAAAPDAVEVISYQIPTFRHHGMLVSFAAFKEHCSFFPGTAIEGFRDELKSYKTGKGTIRFPSDEPLPAALVTRIVQARIAQNEALRPAKA
jgi:uncharacterized protein YdhG (YjbR/CyaY superfamily)